METISELAALLLPQEEQEVLVRGLHQGGTKRIVVLKQYRFHKSLCIELYDAAFTQAGKPKNPLTYVNPLDAALSTSDPAVLQFFAAISRFQNNPTAAKSATDIIALKTIIKNPLGLSFFLHDPKFSEKVVAGALQPVQFGKTIRDANLVVNRQDSFYDLTAWLQVQDGLVPVGSAAVLFDYFIAGAQGLHLLGNQYLVRLVPFFKQRSVLRMHQTQFNLFYEQVLARLENHLTVTYTYVQAATKSELREQGLEGATEKLLYLSDLGQFVAINPVMRYGAAEVPIRGKKPVHVQDERGKILAMERNEKAENDFIALLLQQHPHFYEQLENDLTYFYLHRDRFLEEEWFLNAFQQWREGGISIFGFNQLKGNKLNSHIAKVEVQLKSGLNWFHVDLQVRFGKRKASLKALQQSVRNKNRFVQLDDGTMGILPQHWIERMEGFFQQGQVEKEELLFAKFSFPTIRELFEAAEIDESANSAIRLYAEKLNNLQAIDPVPVPGSLRTNLRLYQEQGLSWLHFLDQHQLGGCLADDMGLGKTVQVIAFMLLLQQRVDTGTHLVVVPTSLLFNWQAELERFAPSLKVLLLSGAGRKRDAKQFELYNVVLVAYGTLLSDISYMRHYVFHYVFLDESQQIKNINSQRYLAVRLLQSRNRIVITGTPVENNTLDLYAQMSFACPGLLGDRQMFKDLFSIPIDKFQSSKKAAELRQKVAPFILRRTKQEVAPELPEKTEMVVYCPMQKAQRKVYDAYEKELRDFIEATPAEKLQQQTVHVLRGLTQLRQICNAPALLKNDQLQGDGSAKLETLIEQIENKAGMHKILVFSQFVSMLELIRKELERSGIDYSYLTGSTQDRKEQVASFELDASKGVFLISLKAGGVGLNLTAADYVFLVDPWWNPAVENQAIDRVHRIGQHKKVVAVRLITPDTVEEKMQQLQERKKALSGALVQADNDVMSQMTKEDWLALLQPNGID